MYANLKVTLPGGEQVYAWAVDVTSDEIIVSTDENDGQSNYAVEGELLRLPPGSRIRIVADF